MADITVKPKTWADKIQEMIGTKVKEALEDPLAGLTTATFSTVPSVQYNGGAYTSSSTCANVTYPVGITTTGTGSTPYTGGPTFNIGDLYKPSVPEMNCPLPQDLLNSMMMLGMAKSKDLLKTKIKEAYKYWLETQKIKYEMFPVLLVASMCALGIDFDLIKEMEEEKKEEPTKNKGGD